MEEKINTELSRTEFSSQEDLKKHISLVQAMVRDYEKDLYEKGKYDDSAKSKVRDWRDKLYKVAQEHKDISENAENLDELESTVKLVHRQIGKADTNQQILGKSTLKLMGLNYTSSDIEKALVDTRRKLKENQRQERTEVFLVLAALLIFILVCMLILFDKFVSTG
ncbi:hypothetical protein KMI_09g15230 [Encephalitozoon hellem]|uniref:Uncharacterized protein n=1 Tax=Encephalitozoon hellem TaxID=27973 RepID=A0A9Q9CCS1_ENCHE|nr:uncharacterized protein EHEL_111750 [Encephalitozoon hellem ATCC 50504]AFM99448.1 hypothetical protein EHEL_111750 [Encephalitozoon hellem ATCC 50504]KAG5859095.1 hypothetical protein KMI_09g15230 [Encephalitozoon hellem]UTX44458.1 hypothetical protein GPU96_11g22620 [Encephalitozoon hellem]WEL39959.1 hypothetical protein PFJ87_11g01970 [Encephalitozoon hellem]|eukprot:XP_003888429.1 hypothetical protein EHEL_111750 [Encephalitozoon hellem ATCC 50504]